VILFGLAPALSALRFDVVSQLKESARGNAPGRQRFAQALVAAEIALAVMLLTGAGLMLKSLVHLANQDLGFDAQRVLRAAVSLWPQRYAEPAKQAAAYDRILERVRSLPGVEAAALAAPQLFPFGGPRVRGAIFDIQGNASGEPRAEVYVASPEYFRLLRIPLLAGRPFNAADTLFSAPVALVSQAVARRHFSEGGAVGGRIRLRPGDASSPWITVIGVTGDVRNPVGSGVQPTLYLPFAQRPAAACMLLVRARGDAPALAPQVLREWSAFDPTSPEPRVADLEQAVAAYISPQRFMTSMLGGFAAAGLLLAAVGVYGVMRYWVLARVGEMGIRAALGAQRSDVFRVVLIRAALTAVAGVMAGVAGALVLQRLIASQLHGVSPADPVVLAAVSLSTAAVALAAAAFPARFAAHIDPLAALREG
jgi:putative ABC transport system permease protein